uniref:Serine/threonine-protein kinase PpkA n=1 Tax=Candidatus Kentrum sp. MB TaxID=2138164 RepID=A0A450XP70_9GAMM|nr:MAG: serine/threonine-protein kinase PpkA [Candidatus Kentron sp. MB]VFK31057.1 MAG: serine/threonine-protein kinase PpkA [Candidatus Kentron sp. MB]VFK75502.1 MAG: serine/threonine-protein kinase PpkA [Candidatus Kentron sp. MB]
MSGTKTNASLLRLATVLFLLATFILPWNPALSLEAPLSVEGHKDFYQRVLSLPDAKLLDEPGGETIRDPVEVFTVYYVFERRKNGSEDWLRVGKRSDRSDGWISASHAEDWKNMLVLQFAPPGQRERVLFFQKVRELKKLLKGNGKKRAKLLRESYAMIEDERAPRGVFAAIEPPFEIAQGRRRSDDHRIDDAEDYRYLLPILDWRSRARFRHGAKPGTPGPDTTLVQVAMVNTRSHETVDPDSEDGREQMAEAGGMLNPALRDARIGVVFVIDTTTSMGPYIKQVRTLVRQVHDRIADSPYHDRIRYGLVAYRDDISSDPRLGYVTKVFQPLDPDADSARIMENLRLVKPSIMSTRGWDEDAFAGLDRAITEDWWEPFQLRLIILVTDAGARPLSDPYASVRTDARTLRTLAEEKDIAIIPMHLKTREARKAGNIASARDQYWTLGDTGDRNVNKYLGIEADTPELFTGSLDRMTKSMLDVLDQWSRGTAIERPEDTDSDQGLIVNELFRAQMEYLGDREGQEIPRFYRGWAADRDLVDPANKSFSINLLLTRSQLSGLAKAVDHLLDKMYTADLAPQDFLNEIQGLAATLSVDPNRNDTTPRTLGNTLPAWLTQIPYRSDILMLTAEDWLQQGPQQRDFYVGDLEAKREIYRQLEADSDRWRRRGQAEELGLLKLEDLP